MRPYKSDSEFNNYGHFSLLKNFKGHPSPCGISLAKYMKQVIPPPNASVVISENEDSSLHHRTGDGFEESVSS